MADLIINDVEIYDATLSGLSTTMQGKLDLINAFQDETDVVASSYLEVMYDMSDTVYIADNRVELNGHSADYGANWQRLSRTSMAAPRRTVSLRWRTVPTSTSAVRVWS